MNEDYKNIVCCLKNKNGYLLDIGYADGGVCYTQLKYETDDYDYQNAVQIRNRIKKRLGIDFEIIVKYCKEDSI